MEPIEGLRILYGTTRKMTLGAQDHENLKQITMELDAFITKHSKKLEAVKPKVKPKAKSKEEAKKEPKEESNKET